MITNITRVCKGTTDYRKLLDEYGEVTVYVNGQEVEDWLYADAVEGEVCCMFIQEYKDGFPLPVFTSGQIATYLRYGKVKIEIWRPGCRFIYTESGGLQEMCEKGK